MSLPQIAIVGRPNVGKSSLLNRLARRRVSIVDPTPGITRDRVSTIVELSPPVEDATNHPDRLVELIDTGGFGVYTAEGERYDDVGEDLTRLTEGIEQQIRFAIDQADIILFVIDAQSGITGLDQTVADLLRRSGQADRVTLVANKVDDDSWESHALDASTLGLGEIMCVSANTGHGVRHLLEDLYRRVSEMPDDGSTHDPDVFKFAIVGKRNAGKSTLINALAGAPRVIVSEIAGTTRDSVDVRFEMEGHTMIAIDTAGLRKRKSMRQDVEYYANHRALQSIRRADVVLLMIDATEDISQVDKKLSQELQKLFKPVVIVVNKLDLVDPDVASPDDYLEYITKELRGLDYAPIVFISAKDGEGLRDVVAMAVNLYRQAGHREPTGSLNQAMQGILAMRGPSSRLGTQAKLYYASQVGVHPPTIVLMVNQPKLFEGQYERYLLNRVREVLPFSEVPIRLIFRARKRMSLNELKHRPRSAHTEPADSGVETFVDDLPDDFAFDEDGD